VSVPLERRIPLAFAAAVAIIGVVGAAALRSTAATVESAGWVAHTLEVRGDVAAVLAGVADAEASARGYLITGGEGFLEGYGRARAALAAALDRLRALTADNAEQRRSADSLAALAGRRLARLDRAIELRRRSGLAAAAREIASGGGPAIAEETRGLAARMQATEDRLLAGRSAVLRRRAREARLAAWSGAALALGLAVLASVFAVRELAARRAAARALTESEQRLFQILDALPVAVFVLDGATGRPYYANRRSQEILGRGIVPDAPPERLPEVYQAVVAGSDRPYPAERQPIVRAMAGEATHVADMEIRRPERRVPIEVWGAPVFDTAGRVAFAVAAFHDISERLRAEEALRQSEERFRTLAATATDGIISADAAGVITYFNPAAERIFGYAAAEAEGRPLTLLMPERFHEAHRAGVARYVATGEARVVGRTVELAGRRRDGTEFPLELSLASWRRDATVAFTAIVRDITERKRAEDELRRYAAQLEAANAELDAFAYSVSHDLRAPLRAIDGFSQALLEDCGDRLDAAGRAHLGRVRQATQRMAQLIDDLLNLSRVTRAQMQVTSVDLSALARRIADELRRSAPDRAVEFVIAPDLVARADPGLLQVALENLLGNAWKFTATRARARIEVGVAAHQGQPAYFVRDDGVGFDMRYADKLFGAFQRLHPTGEFPGTGIGLATVQRIVHRHGGRVWAEGAVGRGATFYFTL